MMTVVGVLVLQIVLPNLYSTIPGPGVQTLPVTYLDMELVVLFLTCVVLAIPFSLPGSLVFATEVLTLCK